MLYYSWNQIDQKTKHALQPNAHGEHGLPYCGERLLMSAPFSGKDRTMSIPEAYSE